MELPETAIERATSVLKWLQLPDSTLTQLVSGALWFEHVGGSPHEDYWNISDVLTMRDEFFAVATAYFATAASVSSLSHKGELAQAFHVPLLFHLKANAQAVRSIDQLCTNNCYSDAFSVIRTLHSRVNLLILFSLNPYLFDEWLADPKDPKFLDGKVRKVLRDNDISTMDHMYEFYSEIIHGQAEALTDVGYFTHGVFPELPAIRNQAYVSGKLLLAAAGHTLVAINKAGLNGASSIELANDLQSLYAALDGYTLAFGRLEHFQTVLAEDRHWTKSGKDKFEAGGAYSSDQVADQIAKFHRIKQPKRLHTPYERREPLAEQDAPSNR